MRPLDFYLSLKGAKTSSLGRALSAQNADAKDQFKAEGDDDDEE
jgi:hypothetical protein